MFYVLFINILEQDITRKSHVLVILATQKKCGIVINTNIINAII